MLCKLLVTPSTHKYQSSGHGYKSISMIRVSCAHARVLVCTCTIRNTRITMVKSVKYTLGPLKGVRYPNFQVS